MTKQDLIDHGAKLVKYEYGHSLSNIAESAVGIPAYNEGFQAAIELLWPMVNALEVCAKSTPYTDPTGIHFDVSTKALTDLEKKIKK